jgi:type VI secretion system protein
VPRVSREQRLLERVAAAGGERASARYQPTAQEDLEALVESVRRHLARLLNSRHGMSEAAPDYGLPTLSELMAGRDESMPIVQEAIRSTIEKYEPRLRRVRVTHQAEEGARQTLAFRVDAVLVSQSGEHRVWYETALRPTGELAVRG